MLTWVRFAEAGELSAAHVSVIDEPAGSIQMSLDDLPSRAPERSGTEPETVVRRVGRASPLPDKITRAEELRLQLADEIVRGVLAPGAALDETDIATRFKYRVRRCAKRCVSSPRAG